MRDTEYDRFGPWILKITDRDPLPPLFIPHIAKMDNALLSIKIPRKIDRRDAAPGWNLYDYVINMYDTDFDIFKREEKNVTSQSFKYTDVVCLRHKEILLHGELLLMTRSSTYSFNYNTVSSDIIKQLIAIIRARYNPNAKTITLPGLSPAQKNELDFYFTNLIANEERINPDNKLVFCQKRESLNTLDKNILKKLFYSITSYELLESLHFFDGAELKIIGKGGLFKTIVHPDYGKEDIYLPVKQISSTTAESKHPIYTRLFIKNKAGSIETAAANNNNSLSDYRKFLDSLC